MRSSSSATNTRQDRSLHLAARLNLALGIVFAAVFVYFAFRARFTVPYVDDWSWLASLQERPFTRGLWQPHNEHVIVIPRLLLWMDFWIWGWPGYARLFAALASHVVVAGLLILASRGRSRDEALLLSGSVLTLTFLTYNLQGTVFTAAGVFPTVAAFSMSAIACVAACAGNRDPTSVARWARLGAVLSVMAMLCLTNGLVVPVILACLALLLRLPPRFTVLFLTVAALGLTMRCILGNVPNSVLLASPTAIARFSLAMLGGPIAVISPRLAVAVGAGFACLALWACWRLLRLPERTPVDVLLTGTIGFVVASVLMASLGRAQFDLSVASESRYAILTAIGWACLLFVAFPPGAAARPLGRIAGACLVAGAIVALPMQVFVGAVWAAKADHLEAASLALTSEVSDDDWMTGIHPLGMRYIEGVLPLLRARHVKFLEFPQKGQQVWSPPVAQCDGSLEAIDPGRVSTGLRVQGHIRDHGETVFILDRDSRVRGVARPAPAVDQPLAAPNDFVWAEWDAWAGTSTAQDDWLGFAAWGAGPPFKAALTDAGGRVVCQAPIACCQAPRESARRQELVVRGSLPEGWLDAASCTLIGGWAWDAARPHDAIQVRIAISDGSDMTIAASAFRQDLLDRRMGSGHHAFGVAVPDLRLPTGTWTVSASIAATGLPLRGSPKVVVCAP